MIESAADRAGVAVDADSLAQMETNDVIVCYPSASDPNQNQVRTVTIAMPLEGPGDSNSVPVRQIIFQNAVCWALNCPACPEVYLTIGLDVQPVTPQTGAPIALTLDLGNGGECAGVAYAITVQLADGLSFASGVADYGQLTHDRQTINLHLGLIPARRTIKLELMVIPQAVGWFTNQVHVQSASTEPRSKDVPIYVQGLSIERNSPDAVLLKVAGQAGSAYEVQQAEHLTAQASKYQWSALTNFVFSPPLFQMVNQLSHTNYGMVYRLKSAQ